MPTTLAVTGPLAIPMRIEMQPSSGWSSSIRVVDATCMSLGSQKTICLVSSEVNNFKCSNAIHELDFEYCLHCIYCKTSHAGRMIVRLIDDQIGPSNIGWNQQIRQGEQKRVYIWWLYPVKKASRYYKQLLTISNSVDLINRIFLSQLIKRAIEAIKHCWNLVETVLQQIVDKWFEIWQVSLALATCKLFFPEASEYVQLFACECFVVNFTLAALIVELMTVNPQMSEK